jgi:tRNA nucleotidyltransferase (CCA-adding enzyme)
MRRIPALVTDIAEACRASGGRAFLVGGGVRDHLLGRDVLDWDLEVFGIDEPRLAEILATIGRVDVVGRSFGVFKVHRDAEDVDVAIPRRDSKAGAGHRGIRVEGDPMMSIREAARRRDLTINAMLEDPLTGEILDPWGGGDDLAARTLRAVDSATFLEDPLRALRVVQLAARLAFGVDAGLERLCAEAALGELPAERIQAEWVKLLLRGVRPSVGLGVARRTGVLVRSVPEAAACDHSGVDATLDRLAALRDTVEPEGRRLALMIAGWLHAATPLHAEGALDRLALHRWRGWPVRERVLASVQHWRDAPADDAALRHLSVHCELRTTLLVRYGVTDDAADLARLDRAVALGVADAAPDPLLKGRHLADLGLVPGPEMGRVLREVYVAQLDGRVTTLTEARAEASIARDRAAARR